MFDRLLSACPAATLCYILTLLCGGLQLLYSMNYGLALDAVDHIVPAKCDAVASSIVAAECTERVCARDSENNEVCTDDTYKCLKVVYRVDLSEFHAGSGAVMMLSEPTGAFTTRTAAQRSAREVQAADALTCWIDSTQSRAEPAVASFTAPTLRGASIFPVVFFFLLFSICACSALRFGQLEDRELKAAIRNARRSLGRPTPPGDLRPAWSARLANWLATPLDWVWERTPAQSSTQANLP
ncbi:unnamed protein product, partial [Symbiodinium sp. KB8]